MYIKIAPVYSRLTPIQVGYLLYVHPVRYQGGLLLGVGDGKRGFRYGTGLLFSQKNCSGSGGMDQRALSEKEPTFL